MIGIGISIALLYYLSKTWIYSAVLASIIIISFMIFRLVGSYLVGSISSAQLSFLVVEALEVAIGITPLYQSSKLNFKFS